MFKKIKNASVTVASKGLGAIHFVSQSIADSAMNIEANIKLKSDGVDKEETKKARVFSTIEKQQCFIDKYESILDTIQALRGKRREKFEEEVIHMTVHEVEATFILPNQ